MSLVAYGCSDDSDCDSDTQDSESFITTSTNSHNNSSPPSNAETVSQSSNVISASSHELSKSTDVQKSTTSGDDSETKLFSSLPAPKTALSNFVLDKLSAINSKQNQNTLKKGPVKITVPSLTQFDDNPKERKKIVSSSKGSGLFALLPPPKNSFLKKSTKDAKQVPLIPRTVHKPPVKSVSVVRKVNPSPSVANSSADDISVDPGDFFSLKAVDSPLEKDEVLDIPMPLLETPVNPDSGVSQLPSNSWILPEQQPSTSCGVSEFQTVQNESVSSSTNSDFIPVDNSDMQLSDEALEQLCGRRAKRKKQDVEIIDVSGSELLPDPKEWLLKQFTEERNVRSHSHRKHNGPTSQQRRKHQITYLAFQAKENELELQNQWSNNRMSRKQTQSKYGF